MGVPAFFRWLSKKYPSIVVHCQEEKPRTVNGVTVPVNTSLPNPNKIEFDNLYLDMNGIIHPCCHPENKPAPKNEDEMMVLIFEYIDRLFSIVRPRRVLYMAIDGVAPRAKMNQQRSRRFRASKESKEMREEILNVKTILASRGLPVPPDKPAGEHFDSNCITPGTEFMFRLADCLRYYVHQRLNTDPGWAGVMVILSDANVPGEGEHKIMDYVRRQRAQPDHDPDTHHCLCGADADLIMLGLATHETNFTIIREEFKPNKDPSCQVCGQVGHTMKECQGMAREKQGQFDELSKPFEAETDFIFLRLTVLREYLHHDLNMTNLPFKQDIERAIDDWVLMCFFVGNDFLPHLPSLEIREGAIDKLITLYKKAVYKTGGYLTDSGTVNLARVQLILTDLGEMEDQIFKRRRATELDFKRRDADKKKRQKRMGAANAPSWVTGGQYAPSALGGARPVAPITNPRQTAYEMRRQAMSTTAGEEGQSNQDAAVALKAMLAGAEGKGIKRKSDAMVGSDDEEPEPVDEVKLWEDGFKERYYDSKFGVSVDDVAFRHKVAAEYVLGICWVLKYYYQGCASWDWYFPYHYAPFASDFVNIGDVETDFEAGTSPFRPLEQLMSVFPAASKQFLPPSWQVLMDDPESPIIDFYPTDFRVDLNGKKFAWQGVALLPFVDEVRLLATLKDVYPDLTDYETKRNIRGNDRLFVGRHYPARDFLVALYEQGQSAEKVELDPKLSKGVRGSLWCDGLVVSIGATVKSPVPQLKDCPNNQAICVLYEDPQYPKGHIFPSRLLKGAKMPAPTLKPADFDRRNPGQSWRPQTGFSRGSGYQGNAGTAVRHIRAGLGGGGMYGQMAPPVEGYGRGGFHGGARGGYGMQGGQGGYGNGSGNPYGGGFNHSDAFQHTPRGGISQPPVSWQRNMAGQQNAYQQNQQRGYQQATSLPPRPRGGGGGGGGGYQGGGYGQSSYGRSPYNEQEIESYNTSRRGAAGPPVYSRGASNKPAFPYPPRRY